MPVYTIHRLKDNLRQQFRWLPHLSGITAVKPKDYEESFSVEAETPYAAWHLLRATDDELHLGDLVAGDDGSLRILKYIGFEEARWAIPEPRPVPAEVAPPVAETSASQAAI